MPQEIGTGFLVASPSLRDPNFAQTVVLLTAHKSEGSLGFIVNRKASMTFREVVTELDLRGPRDAVPDVPVLAGGPVGPETGWVLFDPKHSPEVQEENVLLVSERLHVSTSRELLERIARVRSIERHLLVLGYSGWGPGQLDEEIKQGTWIPVDLDEHILFETPIDERWSASLRTLGIHPWQLVGMPAGEA